jgi:hypothetical protein
MTQVYFFLALVFLMAVVGDVIGIFIAWQNTTRLNSHDVKLTDHESRIKKLEGEIVKLTEMVTGQFVKYLALLDDRNNELETELVGKRKRTK